MKKLLVLLALLAAFTLTGVAQTSSSSDMGQSGQTATKSKSKKSAASDSSKSDTMGKPKKDSTLTGCLSSDGTMLTNGRHKKGVKVGPADKVKGHEGHQVQLTGQWSGTGADKSFEIASMKHISETCKTAPGGGTTGETKKGKKDKTKDSGAAPKS